MTLSGCAALAARVYGVPIRNLHLKCKRQECVLPRQGAMLLAKEWGHSLSSIARFFDMDHTTVIHSVTRAKARRDEVRKQMRIAQ